LNLVAVLAVDPFAVLNSNYFGRDSLFFFFVTWFRARTRVRWVALEFVGFFVGIV
jgi:hypothetical protein